jgi:hypothetical protein
MLRQRPTHDVARAAKCVWLRLATKAKQLERAIAAEVAAEHHMFAWEIQSDDALAGLYNPGCGDYDFAPFWSNHK